MADTLETAFRELAGAPEPPGLDPPSEVRRRGDQRRRSGRAGAVVVAAVVAVGAIGVVDVMRHTDQGSRVIPGGSPPASDLHTLPDDPFLVGYRLLHPGEIPQIGPYTHLSRSESVPGTADGPPLGCVSSGLADPVNRPLVSEVVSQAYSTDQEATLVETVVLFRDDLSATSLLSALGLDCLPARRGQGMGVQGGPLVGLSGKHAASWDVPQVDGEIEYLEWAYAQRGNVGVVLEWRSSGLPHGEDVTVTDTWQFALTPLVVQRALDRATDGPMSNGDVSR